MPKKKRQDTPEEQRKRFDSLVRKMEDDGDLDPIEADAALDGLVKRSRNKPKA